MSNIDKQWLTQKIADMEEHRDLFPGDLDDDHGKVLAALRIALASLEAEPVAWMWELYGGGNMYAKIKPTSLDAIPLYTAPPAPVSVPDLKGLDEFIFNLVSAIASEELSHNEKELFRIASKYISYARERFSSAMLQGAERVTTANKLRDAVEIIRNSGIEIDAEKIFAERDALNAPDCWCRTCRPITPTDMRFVVCPDCGNKRCPHANDHRNACTGSNEPGQEGSAYPAAPQQE